MMMQRSATGARAGHTRAAAPRVRPFTAATRRVAVRVAESEVDAALLEPIVLEDTNQAVERVVLDADAKLAARVADELLSSYTLEAQVEALLEEADKAAPAKAASLLEEGLEASTGALSGGLAAAAQLAANGLASFNAEGVEDVQGPAGFRKYDEQDGLVVPDEAQAAVQRLKLTRQELANLVPADWASVNVDWFTNKKEENIPLPEYKLTFLWQRENISVAVDQVYSRGQVSPLTEYFIWPRKDAWDELRTALEARPFVSETDKVLLLNRLTEVINFWQEQEEKPTIEQARASFPDCAFT